MNVTPVRKNLTTLIKTVLLAMVLLSFAPHAALAAQAGADPQPSINEDDLTKQHFSGEVYALGGGNDTGTATIFLDKNDFAHEVRAVVQFERTGTGSPLVIVESMDLQYRPAFTSEPFIPVAWIDDAGCASLPCEHATNSVPSDGGKTFRVVATVNWDGERSTILSGEHTFF